MDAFIEKIVRKKKSAQDKLKVFGLIVAAVVLMFASVAFLPLIPVVGEFLGGISFFFVIGIGFGAWWLITSMNVEYEYIVTNMDLDIDRITAQRKRKRMLSVKSKDFEICAKRNGPHFREWSKGSYPVLDYSGSPDSPDCWFAVVPVAGKPSLVLFEPDERMIQNFRRFSPNKVKFD